jgi:hypothetical protein
MLPKVSSRLIILAAAIASSLYMIVPLTSNYTYPGLFHTVRAVEAAEIADLDEIPANKWGRVETTGNPPRKVFHGAAAIAPDRDEVFFFGADTHDQDYDNGIFRLNLESLNWSRDYEADPIADYILTPDNHSITNSGRPWAMHTFDSLDYDPVTRKLILVGSANHAYKIFADFQKRGLFIKDRIRPATWLYDPDTKTWELVRTNSPSLFAYGLVWDPLGQQFIGHNGLSTFHYNSARKQWQSYKAATVKGYHRKMVFDTYAGRVLTLGHNGGSNVLYSYDPKTHTWAVVETIGKTVPANGAALAYDTHNQVMLYLANDYHNQYNNPTGRSKTFIYDSKTKTWKHLGIESPELYGMNYLTQYDPVRKIFLHFERSKDSEGKIAVWAFRYKPRI